MTPAYRLGLIVPSSNTTMETELPELFRRRADVTGERFSFHSARMRMTRVTPEALAAMDRESDRCAVELADADCDLLAYACLVAIVCGGLRAHMGAATRLSASASNDRLRPVVTSAGALAGGIHALGARRVALIAPYLPELTSRVVAYLADMDIEVVDSISLSISDNRQVGRLDPSKLVPLTRGLDLRRADAIVLSACVQMPSLASIPMVEEETGLPVLSAATATAYQLLQTLGVAPMIPDAGSLLGGQLALAA